MRSHYADVAAQAAQTRAEKAYEAALQRELDRRSVTKAGLLAGFGRRCHFVASFLLSLLPQLPSTINKLPLLESGVNTYLNYF